MPKNPRVREVLSPKWILGSSAGWLCKFSAHWILGILGLWATWILAPSCNDPAAPDFIQSTGKETAQARQMPGAIGRIILEDDVDLVLTPDSGSSLQVTGGANLLPDIATDYAAGTLTIRNRNRFRWVRSYRRRLAVQAPAAALLTLEHKGTGAISCRDTLDLYFLDYKQYGTSQCSLLVRTGRVAIDVNGSGRLVLAGRAFSAYMATAKLARLDAAGFRTSIAQADSRGAQPLVCRVADSLSARITNRGDIVVWGQPKLSLVKTGSGSVLFR